MKYPRFLFVSTLLTLMTFPLVLHAEEPAGSSESAAAESTDEKLLVMETTEGKMVFEFWPDVAPKTVENFKKLVSEGFYAGTAFHRIIDGFMVQGGDPLTKDPANEARFGTGSPGYTIDAEFNKNPHVRGVLSMARGPDPDSAGSQFFIMLGTQPALDGQYTAFGKLVEGDDVLTKIGKTPVEPTARGEMSKPTKRVEIEEMELVDDAPAKDSE